MSLGKSFSCYLYEVLSWWFQKYETNSTDLVYSTKNHFEYCFIFYQVLVWHTRTEKADLRNEQKLQGKGLPGSDINIEVWQLSDTITIDPIYATGELFSSVAVSLILAYGCYLQNKQQTCSLSHFCGSVMWEVILCMFFFLNNGLIFIHEFFCYILYGVVLLGQLICF